MTASPGTAAGPVKGTLSVPLDGVVPGAVDDAVGGGAVTGTDGRVDPAANGAEPGVGPVPGCPSPTAC